MQQAWAGAAIGHLRYRGTDEGLVAITTGDGSSDYRPECRRVCQSGRPALLMWGCGDAFVQRAAAEAEIARGWLSSRKDAGRLASPAI
jgi:hypothetical protein